ncbi:MAG: ExbD/TolR family protein [Puniceicoccales bacterium]
MVKRKKKPEEKVSIPIAPMIDCVFLLLIYFMVSSTLQRQEADISFQLPGTVEQEEPLDMPDEQIIEITGEGQVIVNDYQYDNPASTRFIELASMLKRFHEAATANQVEALVTVAPADGTSHQAIIKVMDAIALAGIQGVNFSIGEE